MAVLIWDLCTVMRSLKTPGKMPLINNADASNVESSTKDFIYFTATQLLGGLTFFG
ncbi:hypothetical protein [uncultured Nostoc sp.]|uniref:hypothetical protein n=1 Tax=uncultured Nostoc sp. TaxID=340711 RepID=UPI0035CA3BC8